MRTMQAPFDHATLSFDTMTSGKSTDRQHECLAFDDEPLDSLLHAVPHTGPTLASCLAAAERRLAAVGRAAEKSRTRLALRLAASLFRDGLAVPASHLGELVVLLRSTIPTVPWPIVTDHGVACESILEPIFRIGARGRHPALMASAGTLLYRWYESGGRYGAARTVIEELLALARHRGKLLDVAVLTNNPGNEYLLEGDWIRIQPHFVQAGDWFAALGCAVEVANTGANRLWRECAMAAAASHERIEQRARELLARLRNDWRRRKALMLLAGIEEQRDHLDAAVALGELGVQASEGIASRHRLEDQRWLDGLRVRHRAGACRREPGDCRQSPVAAIGARPPAGATALPAQCRVK